MSVALSATIMTKPIHDITDLLHTVTGGAARTTASKTPSLVDALKSQVGGPETQFQAGRITNGNQAQMMGCRPINGVPGASFCTDLGTPQTIPTPAAPQ